MNPNTAVCEPVQSSRRRFGNDRRRFIAAIALLVIGAGGFWFLAPNPALLPKAVILPSEYSIKAQPLPFPDQWIPPTWGWLWKLRYALLGKPITVTIDTEMILLRRPGYPGLRQVVEDIPYLAASNGLRLWILPENKLNELTERLYVDSYYERDYLALTQWPGEPLPSRVNTVPTRERRSFRTTLGPGVVATLSMTSSPPPTGASLKAGDIISYAVHPHGKMIGLTSTFTSSEIVTNTESLSPEAGEAIRLQTNFTLAAQLQIPSGHGAFLYDTNSAGPNHLGVGLLIRMKSK